MKFRTELIIPEFSFPVAPQDHMLFVGSCFTEHIGNYLSEGGISCGVNPYGTLYNPLTIFSCINDLIENRKYTANDLEFYQELWFSFSHHSEFSSSDQSEVLSEINSSIEKNRKQLLQSKILFLTLGSAFVYVNRKSQEIVGNCHKLPADTFSKHLLQTDQIVNAFREMIMKLRSFCPEIKVVLSISPVKHLRDGIVENVRSKSVLLSAAHQICEEFSHCFYFPAYEFLNEDLRDYRFYSSDLAHPNNLAIDYIREKFTKAYLSSEALDLLTRKFEIRRAMQHRPFRPDTEAHQKFLRAQILKIEALKKQFPFLNVEEELNYFKQ